MESRQKICKAKVSFRNGKSIEVLYAMSIDPFENGMHYKIVSDLEKIDWAGLATASQ